MKCIHCDKASRHIHPDIIEVKKLENKSIIGVDQIRELKQDVYVVPNDAMKKAYIVRDADSMNTNAQNAFLQILEEPPAHAVFILCTNNPAALLPTVRSRCVDLKTRTPGTTTEDTHEFDDLEEIVSNFIEALKSNNIKLMECMFHIDKLDRNAFRDFLTLSRNEIIRSLRKNSSTASHNANKALINAENILIKAGEMLDLNVSPGHISGFICASLII